MPNGIAKVDVDVFAADVATADYEQICLTASSSRT